MKFIKVIQAVIIFFIMFFCFGEAFADVMPTYTSTIPKNVYGFLQINQDIELRKEPSKDAPVVDTINWSREDVFLNEYKLDPSEVFAVFVPGKKLSLCYVMDEEDGWYKILYDKKNMHNAWVKPKHEDDFLSLKDFYTDFGKKYTLYYLKDVDTRTRILKSAPSDEAQSLQGFTIAKNIKMVMVRGNWVLVSVIDYEGTVPKTGYLKWRNTDGTIYLFPQIN